MTPLEVIESLWAWTPFLAMGFIWNILISITAMAVGTAIGYGFVLLRLARIGWLAEIGSGATELTRNIPTFVFQFYLAFMLPDSIRIPFSDTIWPFPSWLKAALALSLAVVGFVSDNLLRAIRARRGGGNYAALLFIENWTNYFVIIVMASSAASVIGVAELVNRCNTVINASGKTQIMLWVYLYAMAWFFVFCYAMTSAIKKMSGRASRKLGWN
jgi:polar amino acid transport system permease protein